jgi:hypothetical protein
LSDEDQYISRNGYSLGMPIARKFVLNTLVSLFMFSTIAIPISSANEYSCVNFDTILLNKDPIWTPSDQKDLKYWVSWSFRDPENCIVGLSNSWGNDFYYDRREVFPTKWSTLKDGENTLLTAEFEIPISFLLAVPNRNLDGLNLDWRPLTQQFQVFTTVTIRQGSRFRQEFVKANYGLVQLWGDWFSKAQGLHTKDCEPSPSESELAQTKIQYASRIIESGQKPKVEITIQDPTNCVFLVHSAPLSAHKNLNSAQYNNYALTLAEYPYWHGEAPTYFSSILSQPNQVLQVVGDLEIESKMHFDNSSSANVYKVSKIPLSSFSHSDSISREGNLIKIVTTIDDSSVRSTSTKSLAIHLGTYRWYTRDRWYSSAGWRVTSSGGTWTARYSPAGSLPGGRFPSYHTKIFTFPIADLVTTAAEKAAAELKAKQEAEAKAAAELKAKQEADAKAATELKAKQDADAKAAADKAAAELKAKQEAEAKAAAELKAKQEAEAKAAAELKAAGEKIISDAKAEAARILAAAKAATAKKKITITCIKGKLIKKVTAVKPMCPKDYKKK